MGLPIKSWFADILTFVCLGNCWSAHTSLRSFERLEQGSAQAHKPSLSDELVSASSCNQAAMGLKLIRTIWPEVGEQVYPQIWFSPAWAHYASLKLLSSDFSGNPEVMLGMEWLLLASKLG